MRNTPFSWTARSLAFLLVVFALNDPRAQASEKRELVGSFYAVSVKDLERAIAWYTEHLEFSVETRVENEQRAGALLVRGEALLELAEFVNAVPRDEDVEAHMVHGIFKLGFVTADLEAEYKSLETAGVTIYFPIVRASDERRTFGVLDMDGNIIQFFGT